MKPSDILNAAADYMLEHGWCQHEAENIGGEVCAHGAMRRVMPSNQWTPAYKMNPDTYPAEVYLQRVIGGGYISVWNDQPSRTEAQVLGAFHEAALLAKEEGQ